MDADGFNGPRFKVGDRVVAYRDGEAVNTGRVVNVRVSLLGTEGCVFHYDMREPGVAFIKDIPEDCLKLESAVDRLAELAEGDGA